MLKYQSSSSSSSTTIILLIASPILEADRYLKEYGKKYIISEFDDAELEITKTGFVYKIGSRVKTSDACAIGIAQGKTEEGNIQTCRAALR